MPRQGPPIVSSGVPPPRAASSTCEIDGGPPGGAAAVIAAADLHLLAPQHGAEDLQGLAAVPRGDCHAYLLATTGAWLGPTPRVSRPPVAAWVVSAWAARARGWRG